MKTIYGFDKIDVLMDDRCTRQEAERHLENGACVWTPEEFVAVWVGESDNPDEVIEGLGYSSSESLLAACKSGELRSDCISSGQLKDGDDLVPYVITYCL